MRRHIRKPDELLPLTPGVLRVLIVLPGGEKHGYAIIKEVARRTDGAMRLSAVQGVIADSNERPEPSLDDERRRYYRLTDFGRAVARPEAARMESSLSMAAPRT